jgi:RNA polymerase sigma-70 factor (ECF subfamily)
MLSQQRARTRRPSLGHVGSDAEFIATLAAAIPSLRIFSRSVSRNRDLAEELTQETLAKAWKSRGSFAPGSNIRAWLFTILRNEFCSHHRRAWRQIAVDPEQLARIPSAPNEQNWAAELSDTVRALAHLPEPQREAVLLVGAGGFSYEEASSICDVALGTMKTRVLRGRAALKALLDGGTLLPVTKSRPGDGSAFNEIMAQVNHLREIGVPRTSVALAA